MLFRLEAWFPDKTCIYSAISSLVASQLKNNSFYAWIIYVLRRLESHYLSWSQTVPSEHVKENLRPLGSYYDKADDLKGLMENLLLNTSHLGYVCYTKKSNGNINRWSRVSSWSTNGIRTISVKVIANEHTNEHRGLQAVFWPSASYVVAGLTVSTRSCVVKIPGGTSKLLMA
jgi:hypothetical protein